MTEKLHKPKAAHLGLITLAVGAILVVAGSLLPWQVSEGVMGRGLGDREAVRRWNGFSTVAETTTDFDGRLVASIGDMSLLGLPLSAGLVAVLLAAAGVALGLMRRHRWAAGCGAAIAGLTVYMLMRLIGEASSAAERFMVVGPSYGIYAVLAGGVLMILSSTVLARKTDKAT